MDVSKINDLNALKVLAYDAAAQREAADRNLQIINARITEVQDAQVKLPMPQGAPEVPKPNRATRRSKK